jgi:hypothetical protein
MFFKNEVLKMMHKFDFLLGEWNLVYLVPKSIFSEAAKGSGTGTFKRALEDKYVYFDYTSNVNAKILHAHAIFGWDEKSKIIRYWWFESSGSFMTASCNFVSDKILFMQWHHSLLMQTFTQVEKDQVVLRMEHPNSDGRYDLVLQVTLNKKHG